MSFAYLTEKTLSGLFFAQAAKYREDPFLWSKLENGVPAGRWVPMSWSRVAREVELMGAGLIELGVDRGDRVAIFSTNRPRWVVTDHAVQGSGAVGVPVYPTSTDEQLSFILNDCKARVVVAGNPQLLEQAVRVRPRIPSLEFIVALSPVEDPPDASVINYNDLLKRGEGSAAARAEFDSRRKSLGPGDVAAIIYTSGTTGEPKGAVLTQRNFMAQNEMLLDSTITNKMVEREARLSSLCHLPLCHVYGRTGDYHVIMCMGGQIWFAESYDKVPQNLIEVRPQMLITIPRLYEKVYESVVTTSERMEGVGKKVFDWALEVGARVVECMTTGQKIPPLLALKFALAGTLVYDKVRKRAGLDRLVFAGSGGGALSGEINRFFRAMNLQIGEGYGLTETTSAVSWNGVEFLEPPPDTWPYRLALKWLIDTMVLMQSTGKNPFTSPVGIVKLTYASNLIVHRLIQKPGTVGRKCKDTEIKLAPDGEILVKGPQVFDRDKGYFNRSDLTDEVFTPDGFFMTGDIGTFDEDGFLIITDRKKELIVTAGGKNVAPHPIELALTLDTYIEQACVIGDTRKYLCALIVPQFELLEKWAADNGLEWNGREQLVAMPEVTDLYRRKVDKVNEGLARYEQIKKFSILPVEFTEQTGELTPTQKMKRRVISDRFRTEIDSCY